MSELEKIVDHVVQHEEKRQAEKIKLESEIKALEEVLEHGISTKFVEEEVIYVYSPKTAHDMREKLEENYKQLHTQLTIPKSIADKLDKDDANNKTVLDWVFATEMIVINDEKELKRREDEILRRRAIVSIYGASKALGVDLVKVGEG